MKPGCSLAAVVTLPLAMLLCGCSLISTTHKLPVPIAPASIQTATADDLVAQLNKRWTGLDTLYATVEIQASVLKTKEGLAKDFTTFRGIIMMRKPEMLRVYGRVPVIGTRMFDMASDGKTFTLYIPSRSKAVKGSNKLKKKSASQVENLRPGFFFDAMVVRGLEPNDRYTVTADTITVEDTAKKHLYSVPEYILSITRPKAGSQQDTPVRVVRFHREDLLPYQQDIYDDDGNLETQVSYANYHDFGTGSYPATVTIKRPLEEYQVVLTVDKVVENMALKDDQFQLTYPKETQVQNLE
jgi:outer membrane lipoprotein-sorting protein